MNEELKAWLAKEYSVVCPHCKRVVQGTRTIGMGKPGRLVRKVFTCPLCMKMSVLEYDCLADSMTALRDRISDLVNASRAAEKQREAH